MLRRFAEAVVVVIDDSAPNVALLKALLDRAGLERVYTFTDSHEAVARLPGLHPDLVLVDLHMPELDGYEVLAHVTELAAGSYLPALVLTGDTSPKAIERALSLGARDFLTKPFDPTEVILRVRNLLETRFLHRSLREHNVQLRAQVDDYRAAEAIQLGERRLEQDRLLRTIRDGAMTTVFQPVLELGTGAVVGVEALARFTEEPMRGPDVWFAEAARAGRGVSLEVLAVTNALAMLEQVPEPLFLALNVSPGTLLSPEFASVCGSELCPRLVFELTEHVPVEDYEVLNAVVADFRAAGVRLAVDDTGAGYAGFRHLLALKPDIVKLDLSLTCGIDTDPVRRALASALVQFTGDTGTALVAEGVETAAELETLRDLGVGWGQGYHLARPGPVDGASLSRRILPAQGARNVPRSR